MRPRPSYRVIRNAKTVGRMSVIALALAATIVATAALLNPAPARSAQQNWVAKATSACEQAGGTLTTPGGNVIFQCTLPPSINVIDILGTRLLLRTLPRICFGPARGNLFGPIVAENAVACFVPEPTASAA